MGYDGCFFIATVRKCSQNFPYEVSIFHVINHITWVSCRFCEVKIEKFRIKMSCWFIFYLSRLSNELVFIVPWISSVFKGKYDVLDKCVGDVVSIVSRVIRRVLWISWLFSIVAMHSLLALFALAAKSKDVENVLSILE